MPLRIGFDMDGVLADFSLAFHEVEERLFGPGPGVTAGQPEKEEEAVHPELLGDAEADRRGRGRDRAPGRSSSSPIPTRRSRGARERGLKKFTARRLFRCDECGWRGWGTPIPTENAAGIEAELTEPDLEKLDVSVTPPERPPDH